MTIIKEYNTGTSQWEPVAVGQQGNTGFTGSRGFTGSAGVTILDLGTSVNTSVVTVTSSSGTDANIVAANTTQAGIVTTLSQSFGGVKTFANTVSLSRDYTETVSSSTGSTTINLSNGTIFKVTTNGSNTITLPSSVAGKSFVVLIAFGGTHTISWAGGTSIEWPGGSAPTLTSASGKVDIISFFQDGSVSYGIPVALDFS